MACLIPLEGMKIVEGFPLIRIEKKTFEIRARTQWIHFSMNPKAVKR